MKAAAAITIILYLVITFQSSYSIICYQCLSGNYSDPLCEQIFDEDYSKPCKLNDNQCVTLRWNGQNGESAFFRGCGSEEYNREYWNTLEGTAKMGIKFGIHSCNSDGCNGFD